jgi:hypothetical protein
MVERKKRKKEKKKEKKKIVNNINTMYFLVSFVTIFDVIDNSSLWFIL